MPYIICYDITSNKARKTIHNTLLTYGEKINLSVFELDLDQAKLDKIKSHLTNLINPKTDTIKIYHISNDSLNKSNTLGKKLTNTNYI